MPNSRDEPPQERAAAFEDRVRTPAELYWDDLHPGFPANLLSFLDPLFGGRRAAAMARYGFTEDQARQAEQAGRLREERSDPSRSSWMSASDSAAPSGRFSRSAAGDTRLASSSASAADSQLPAGRVRRRPGASRPAVDSGGGPGTRGGSARAEAGADPDALAKRGEWQVNGSRVEGGDQILNGSRVEGGDQILNGSRVEGGDQRLNDPQGSTPAEPLSIGRGLQLDSSPQGPVERHGRTGRM